MDGLTPPQELLSRKVSLAMNQASNDDLDAQQDLLETSLEIVFAAYDEARQRGVEQPVVMLVDCEDEIGSQIVRGWLGDEAVDDAIGEQRESDETEMTTVFAYGFPLAECSREIPQVFPYLEPVFDTPPSTDGFLAISVTSGGASALTVPWAARPE